MYPLTSTATSIRRYDSIYAELFTGKTKNLHKIQLKTSAILNVSENLITKGIKTKVRVKNHKNV